MPLFRHTPTEVEAIRLTRDQEINGRKAKAGQWLIGRGVKDKMYPIDAEVFDESYEPADDDAKEYYRRMTEDF